MTEGIIVGILSLIGTLAGTYFANRKSSALIAYRLELLEKKVDKHNSVVERTFKLEEQTAVIEEKIKVANHRIYYGRCMENKRHRAPGVFDPFGLRRTGHRDRLLFQQSEGRKPDQTSEIIWS